ncbi:hypothetical protein M7I_4911 [Glarea lozoyensis 74030]|uniref:Uncharacterized protein n=1 Tax=Glarea lozoyensis (strain ATCC 74030 / MF5533) TaxID=1104152 RepID=H0EQG2_GLAL7|nr:hypothetical protein M7I_4911 [Glarea lozoyensis 74030]
MGACALELVSHANAQGIDLNTEEVPLLPSSNEVISALLHLGAKADGNMTVRTRLIMCRAMEDTNLGKRKLEEFESGFSDDDLDEESEEDEVQEVTRAEFIAKRVRYAAD